MNSVLSWCRSVVPMAVALLLTWPMLASAQTTSNGTIATSATSTNPDDAGKKKTLVATVFGEALYLEQFTPAEAESKRKELPPGEFENWLRGYQATRIYDTIWAAVSKKYIERERLEVSKEEFAGIQKSAERTLKTASGGADESPFPTMEQKGIGVAWARASFIDWKLCKSLYEKYGGRVGMGSLGLWIALDGQYALLKEHQKTGDLKFHHAQIESAFWKYAQREHFADAYPQGDDLKRLLGAPPYLRANAVAPVETDKRERIGSALGQDIYRDQLKDTPPTYHQVVKLFMAPPMEEFEHEHGAVFEMTDDEIRAGVDWMEAETKKRGGPVWEHWQAQSRDLKANVDQRLAEIKRQLESPATLESERPLLKTALRVTSLEATHPHAGEVWMTFHRRKFEKYLHCNYGGGRIIHQQFGPEALDARRKLLLEMEESGKFQITDPELRKLAYDYWERPSHPGGFHTDHRILMFPWTKAYQEMIRENESPVPATIR